MKAIQTDYSLDPTFNIPLVLNLSTDCVYVTDDGVKINNSIYKFQKFANHNHQNILDQLTNIISVNPFEIKAVIIDIKKDIGEFIQVFQHHSGIKTIKKVFFLWSSMTLSISDMLFLSQQHLAHEFLEDVYNVHAINLKIHFLSKYQYQMNRPNLVLAPQRTHLINKRIFNIIKRGFDILLSLFLLIVCAPLLLLVALAIKLESKGPIFYISSRVGHRYTIFPMFKFRSMKLNADQALEEILEMNMYANDRKSVSFIKIIDDPRVTSVGKFLRKTSIDELPQLVNVLMGHMSIVGNRPLPLYEAEKLLVNEYVERFDAPAGITGLWQVKKKKAPYMSEKERIGIDIEYARNQSFLKDLMILLKTPKAMFQEQHY
ncbi:MAG: sugar transferase [Chitinophagaceae bacterium]